MSNILKQDIMYVNGVGPTKKQILNKELGIMTIGDMLEYYPYKYVDRSRIYTISSLTQDMSFVQIKGRILSFETFQMGVKKKRLVAHFGDGTGVVDLVWFSGTQYITKNFKVGIDYIVFGKPTVFGGRFQFTHPEIEKAENLQLSSDINLYADNFKVAYSDVTTSIDNITEFPTVKARGWFDINGRRLNGKPAQKGIYINNGNKVLVK